MSSLPPRFRLSVHRRTSARDQALFDAIHAQDASRVEQALDKGADVDAVSNGDFRPLHAALFGRAGPEILKLLLARNPTLEVLTENGVTPLGFAISSQSLACVKLLVEAGANVNGVEEGGWPLRRALDCLGSDDVAAYLVRCGAKAPAEKGAYTPIYQAVAWKRPDALSEMLTRGWSIEMRDAEGLTALMQAVKNENIDAVRCLIDAGADPNAIHETWGTPLKMALQSKKNYRDLITELLKGGADIDLPENEHVRSIRDRDAVKDLFNDAARLRREYIEAKYAPFTDGTAAQVPVHNPLRFRHA